MFFPREEYELRWAKVWAAMRERGHDVLVVWQRSAGTFDRAGNVYWLSNFASAGTGQSPADPQRGTAYSFAAMVFRPGSEPELHMSQSVEETKLDQVACGPLFGHQDLIAGLAAHLGAAGVEGRVAVVGDDILPGMYDRILRAATPQIEWVPQDNLIDGPQQVKSERELEAFRIAGDIASRAMTAAMTTMLGGLSGAEAAARAAAIILAAGGNYHRMDMGHGPMIERYMLVDDFHGFDTSAPAVGDMVRGWLLGPLFQGYWLDPGRSGVCGNRPTSAQKLLLEGPVDVVDAMIDAVRPGASVRELTLTGRSVARKFGFDEQSQFGPAAFVHSNGAYFMDLAGSGWDDAEPEGAAGPDCTLQVGMVIGVEAFLTHAGVGTAGFEQNLIVTDTGAELLTTTQSHFW